VSSLIRVLRQVQQPFDKPDRSFLLTGFGAKPYKIPECDLALTPAILQAGEQFCFEFLEINDFPWTKTRGEILQLKIFRHYLLLSFGNLFPSSLWYSLCFSSAQRNEHN
jgi:hypothetical protein